MNENNTSTPEEENPGSLQDRDCGSGCQPAYRSGRRRILLPAAVSLAVLVVVAVLCAICLPKLLGSTSSPDVLPISAFISRDGTATFVTEAGDVVTVKGGVTQAIMSPDRQHIAAVYEDGSICILNSRGGNKTPVAQGIVTIVAVRNDGFLFTRDDGNTYCRCLWKDSAALEIAAGVTYYRIAEDNLNFLCVSGEGITVLRTGDEAPTLLQNNAEAQPLSISEKNGIAVWSVTEGSGITIYVASDDNEAAQFGEIEIPSDESSTCWRSDVYFTGGEKELLIFNQSCEELLYGMIGGKGNTLDLGLMPCSYLIYTESGVLPSCSGDSIDGFYMELRGEDNHGVYYVSLSGECVKLADDDADLIGTSGGWLYYTTSDDDLRAVRVSGAEAKDDEKIDSYVAFADIGYDRSLYYFRLYDSRKETATLCYKDSNGAPETLDSDIFPGYYFDPRGSVAFFEKCDYISSDSHTRCGTMYIFDGKDCVRVASDVAFVQSTSSEGYALDRFAYLKFDYRDTDEDGNETVYCKLCWYDGKNSTTIADDIIYKYP